MLRAFAKDSFVYAVPAFVSRGLAFFLIPLYTRVLPPRDYGSLDLFLSFAAIIHLTIALEISQGLARFFPVEASKSQQTLVASTALWFTVFCYSVFSCFMIALAPVAASVIMGQSDLVSTFRIGILYIWVYGVYYLVQNQFRWELKSRLFAAVSLVMSLITATASVLLTLVYGLGLNGLLIAMLVGVLVGMVLGICLLKHTFRLLFDFKILAKLLSFSLPLVISGLFVWLSSYLDRLIINHYLNVSDVGLYGLAYRLAAMGSLVSVGLQGSVTPLIYSHFEQPDTPSHLETITRWMFAFSLFVILLLSLFSSELVGLLATPDYQQSATLIPLLAPALILSSMYVLAPGMTIANKTTIILLINGCGALLNLLFCTLGVRVYGLNGAAFATFASCLFVFVLYIMFSQKYYYVPHQWPRVCLFSAGVLAVAFCSPLIQYLGPLRLHLALLIICLYPLLLVASGMVRLAEVKRIAQFIK